MKQVDGVYSVAEQSPLLHGSLITKAEEFDEELPPEKKDVIDVSAWKMAPYLQVLIVTVVGLNSMYWTCFFPIQYDIASWLGESRFYGSLVVGVLFAPFPFASYVFKRIMKNSRLQEGDGRESYALWTILVVLGSGSFTILLFFPNFAGTATLLILAQIIGGASQAIIFVCRQVIVLTTLPATRVFYYALYTGSNDFGAGSGILLTGVLAGFAGHISVVNGTPLKLVLPTAVICVTVFLIGIVILCTHPRKPKVVPPNLRQLTKPPPASVKEAFGLSSDDRKRLCIVACYVVGFNRVIIKTMWFSISLLVWEEIFDYSALYAAVSVFAVTTTGVIFQQMFAYLSHLLPDRTWMQASEIGLFVALSISLVVDKLDVGGQDVNNLRIYRLILYYLSSFLLYLACQIQANVANVFATKYAIPHDSKFDQPAIGFWQTILQNCLAKFIAPILATALWSYGGFTAYNIFSIGLAATTILFSNIFILGSDEPQPNALHHQQPSNPTYQYFTKFCVFCVCSD